MAKENNFARQKAKVSESSGSGHAAGDNKRSHHPHANVGVGAAAGRLDGMVDFSRPANFKAVGRAEDYAWQGEEDEDINESADEFIRRFRQNLRLQRLQSIENYKQMLARGL